MSVPESLGSEALYQLPAGLRAWLALERFHLYKIDAYQRRERDPEFDTSYLPQHCGAFRIPCFLIPRKNLHVFGSQQQDAYSLRFHSDIAPDGDILFPIHPLSLDRYRAFLERAAAYDAVDAGLRLWAVPTSSTRTLLTWLDGAPQSAVFVKTSLDTPMLGDRRVHRVRAARSVGLSALVAAERDEMPRELVPLPEPCAFTARTEPGTGAIIRTIPREIFSGGMRFAPLFSLLGGEETGHEPLLLTMLDLGVEPAVEFIERMLCKPLAQSWIALTMKSGFIVEAHAQDLLLELTPQLRPTGRLFYRDFEGMQVDWELRRRLGKPVPDELPNAWQWHESYETWGAYPYCSLTWYKWRISLVQILRMVLHEMELSLQRWHQRGLIGGKPCPPGELTMAFSRHVFETLERMFGVRVSAPYNIESSLNRFLLLLGTLRRELIGLPLARPAERAA